MEINKEEFLKQAKVAQVGAAIDAKAGVKRLSAAREGVTNPEVFKLLDDMKNGVLTNIRLALDGNEESTAYVPFRILSAKEEFDIKKEMQESGLKPNQADNAYELLFIIKRLSKATQPVQNPLKSDEANQVILTENDMFHILSENQVLALGLKYNEFILKCSPKLREYKQEELQEVIDAVSEALDEFNPKLREATLGMIFSALESNATFEALIECVNQLKTLTQQMDKLRTGS